MGRHARSRRPDPARAALVADGLAGVEPLEVRHVSLFDRIEAARFEPDVVVVASENPDRNSIESLREATLDVELTREVSWATVRDKVGVGTLDGADVVQLTVGRPLRMTELLIEGFNAGWADENPDALRALLRALIAAAVWADPAENRDEPSAILAQPHFVGPDTEIIWRSLSDMILHADGVDLPQPPIPCAPQHGWAPER